MSYCKMDLSPPISSSSPVPNEEQNLGKSSGQEFQEMINSEALVALEKSLKLEEEQLEARQTTHDKMMAVLEACHDESKKALIAQLQDMENEQTVVTGKTKLIISERDETLEEYRKVEQQFYDVFRKYERTKSILEKTEMKKEHTMRGVENLLKLIISHDHNYEVFKQDADKAVNRMYEELSMKVADLDFENARLDAQLRRSQMRVESLESELQHKQRENNELNTLADELIGKSVASIEKRDQRKY